MSGYVLCVGESGCVTRAHVGFPSDVSAAWFGMLRSESKFLGKSFNYTEQMKCGLKFMGSASAADLFFCILVSIIHGIWDGA